MTDPVTLEAASCRVTLLLYNPHSVKVGGRALGDGDFSVGAATASS